MKSLIQIKRVYDAPLKKDGFRILVDRLWPRGVSKEIAALDEWAKDVAPSPALRKWYDHDPKRWTDFKRKYRLELEKNEAAKSFIESHNNKKLITLVYGAKDEAHSHALVLQQFLQEQ